MSPSSALTEDVDITGLALCDPRLSILGASSDHLIMDVTAAGGSLLVGDMLAFSMNYSALLAAVTSPYVGKWSLPGHSDTHPWPRA
jgi:predicted amino acid racemase